MKVDQRLKEFCEGYANGWGNKRRCGYTNYNIAIYESYIGFNSKHCDGMAEFLTFPLDYLDKYSTVKEFEDAGYRDKTAKNTAALNLQKEWDKLMDDVKNTEEYKKLCIEGAARGRQVSLMYGIRTRSSVF